MPKTSKVQIKDRGIAPHLALIAVQLIFGTWPIVGKVALRGISSSGLVAFRVVGAAMVFVLGLKLVYDGVVGILTTGAT